MTNEDMKKEDYNKIFNIIVNNNLDGFLLNKNLQLRWWRLMAQSEGHWYIQDDKKAEIDGMKLPENIISEILRILREHVKHKEEEKNRLKETLDANIIGKISKWFEGLK